MGTSFGVAFIDNEAGMAEEMIAEKLHTVPLTKKALEQQAKKQWLYEHNMRLQKEHYEQNKSRISEKTNEQVMEIVRNAIFGGYKAKALCSPASRWCCISNTEIMECGGKTAVKSLARRYAAHFGAPCLAMAVFDSDIVYIGYSGPKRGEAEVYVNGRTSRGVEKSGPPAALLKYIPDGRRQELVDVWDRQYTYAEDRMKDIAALAGIFDWLVADNENPAPLEGLRF